MLPRSLRGMLAASGSAPNSPRLIPTPVTWRGVSAGLREARQAYQAGKLEMAELSLREVLEFAPAEAKAWAWLGKVLQARGVSEEAAQCLGHARKLLARKRSNPVKPLISIKLAKLLWQQGSRKSACEMVKTLLDDRPDDAELNALIEHWSQEETA